LSVWRAAAQDRQGCPRFVASAPKEQAQLLIAVEVTADLGEKAETVLSVTRCSGSQHD
jgi:hypothetical protein